MKEILPLLSLILILSCSSNEEDTISSNCRDTNCTNYISQAAAQAAFDADPECRNDLDRDNDRIACEEPGNNVRTCASTSSCGCSSKRKAECERDPCCKWITGSGCDCR